MFNNFKKHLKNWRPAYRLIHGLRALSIGLKGILQRKKGPIDHLGSTISFLMGSKKILGRPMNITIEPSNACNLRCPICETGAGILGRQTKHMSMDNFQKITDKIAPYTNTLMFYFMGEPFINKDAYRMIRFAKEKKIPFVTTCTNGDVVDPHQLVHSGLDEVSFQIGGMSQETHEIYRINSNLDRVLGNLKETIKIRNENKKKMRIICGLILMKHNQHQIAQFQKELMELGVDHASIIDPGVRTLDQGKQYLPDDKSYWAYDETAFQSGVLKPIYSPPNACPWIYYSLSIHVNGDVVPCCRDPLGKNIMGNLLAMDLDQIWNGEKYLSFREKMHKNQSEIEICRLCSAYPPSPIK